MTIPGASSGRRRDTRADQPGFLAGGGEMGERIRAFDWSKTPIGSPRDWPQSLKTVVQVMLDSKYPMFVWWGREFVNLYNDGYAPILGKRHPEALGRPAPDVWSEIWDTVGQQAQTVRDEGRPNWHEELPLTLERNGYPEESYFTYSYSPVADDGGGIGGVFCACTEETQRVIGRRRMRTLRALAEIAAQTKTATGALEAAAVTLAENINDLPFTLLYLLDDDGERATLVGSSGLDWDTPCSPASIDLGDLAAPWPFRDVVASGTAVEVSALTARFGSLPGGAWPESPERAVVLPMKKPGQTRLAGFVVAGVSSRLELGDEYAGFLDLVAGHVASAVANARAHEAEKKRAEALAELDLAKTAFFSNVSHEFRTPLTLLLGPIEDLLAPTRTDLPPAAAAQLAVVHRNALRLLRLVNTLLDFSRIEAGRVRALYEPTDLAEITAELAAVFRAAVERAGLRLVVDCPRLDEPVFVDRDMWEKVVLNLLSNAFKFTFEGEIAVALRRNGESVEVEVRDTGTGIPAQELPRVFERFHRVENARGRTHEGSGIGLALVRELVHLHGGEIGVQSSLGEGTTFTITLPLGSAHLPRERIGERRARPSSRLGTNPFVEEALLWLPHEERGDREPVSDLPLRYEAVPANDPADTRPLVLLADDNADMRQYVVRLLAERYRIEAKADGEAALASALARVPDLVLSDVMMPRLDGFGLLRALRADPRTRDVPVILLSARAGEESRVQGMEAGADDYLIKPFHARELVARVSAHLQMARARREADRRKDEFLAILAHELRGPLAPLGNMLEVLKRAGGSVELIEQARATMERQLVQLVRLVDDLLDVSRITRNKLELRKQRVDLASLVHHAAETCRPLAESLEHELTVTLPPAPIWLDADPVRLAQVFHNLVHNACKYTERKGRVWLTAELEGAPGTPARIVVRVRDSGLGIPPSELASVFEMFTQVDRSLERAQGGLGIGLTIVKRLVEMHGGTVEARSEGLGRGSEFVVRLPVLDERQEPERSTATGDHARAATDARRFLVVDDNPDSAASLAMLLGITGHETRTVHDGLAAVSEAGLFQPDVVLLDIGLPKLNGYDAARRIREQPWGRSMVLVALTGWGQEADRRKSREAGFDLHVVKPVDVDALMKTLASLRSEREAP